ncbi:hypothetical protein D3W54_15320 [Komagataeibacter medellinensis]|uniref:Uncharacterized protein n=1 Tax=Komagataeibacter medellinensis TaxID=1177712 RepID=A0ABQ6VRY7_9PROT|nr:hypothetical protein D3W54_15320 [Komagataeibacter medellinensis]
MLHYPAGSSHCSCWPGRPCAGPCW